MLKKLHFKNTLIDDGIHTVLATKETSIDCQEPASRETDRGNTVNATKQGVDYHKKIAPRETTADNATHAVNENHTVFVIEDGNLRVNSSNETEITHAEPVARETAHDAKESVKATAVKESNDNKDSTIHIRSASYQWETIFSSR